MPATLAPFWRRKALLAPFLLAMLAGTVRVPAANAQTEQANKPILAPPPLVWDRQMLAGKPLLSQTVSDLTRITAGIAFGMGPGEVNAQMPAPTVGVIWSALPSATEFQDDVRYFWIRFEDARDLRAGAKSCAGDDSYIVFLFLPRGLFRISYRLMPSASCTQTADAAQEVLGRYVTLSTDVALTVHYHAGPLEIVDVTDPTSGTLASMRWQPRAEE